MSENSVLVIEKYGSYVKKAGNRFLVIMPHNEKKEYSAEIISQLVFVAPSAISSEAVRLATEKNIDIVYLDNRGKPFARTYSPTMGGTTLTRRRQVEAYFSTRGSYLVKQIVFAKIKSQMNYLKSLAKDRQDSQVLQELCKKELAFDFEYLDRPIKEIRMQLLGIEGSVAARYFKALGLITGFSGRDLKSRDIFNICLNYAYGMLYNEVERACILAGLDPFLGFYHTDRYGKPSMVLDLMELFRVAVADRAVVSLLNLKQIKEDDFEGAGDLTLSRQGRKKIIEAVIKRLNTRLYYNGRKLTLKDIIVVQARETAAYLLNNKRDFKPFIYH